MAKTALRNKIPELERALTGSVGHHQRFLLRSQFRLLESIEGEIASLDEEVTERMRPFQVALERLEEIPGIGRRAAEQILVETGTDMSRFPTSAHFASWARVCPGNNESAGKQQHSSIGGGNRWLRNALLEAAWTVSHSRKQTFFTSRLSTHRGTPGQEAGGNRDCALPARRRRPRPQGRGRLPGPRTNPLRAPQP